MKNKTDKTASPSLLRALGPVATTAVMVGSVVGSGIFLVPNTIAAHAGGFGVMMLVWLAAGLLTLFGALSYAELGAMIPDVGGQYAYLREAYGRLPAFLFGWTEFLVVKAGSIAAVAVAFAMYSGIFIPERMLPVFHRSVSAGGFTFEEIGVKAVAILCILALSIINYLGVKFGGWVQNVFTFLKVGALLGLVASVFLFGHRAAGAFHPIWPSGAAAPSLSAFGIALVAALWAFDGWNNTTYMAAEVVDPRRNIPVALAAGSRHRGRALSRGQWGLCLRPSIDEDRGIAARRRGRDPDLHGSDRRGIDFRGRIGLNLRNRERDDSVRPARDLCHGKGRAFFRVLGDVHPRFRTPHAAYGRAGGVGMPADAVRTIHDPLDAADAGERGQVRLALLRAGRAHPGHPRVALVERLVHARLRQRHDRRDHRPAAPRGGGAGLRLLARRTR